MRKRQELLEEASTTLRSAINAASNSSKPTSILSTCRSPLGLFNFEVPMSYQEFLEMQEAYLDFFEEVTGELQNTTDQWYRPLQLLSEVLVDFRDWYEFCLTVEQTITSYALHTSTPSLPDDSSGTNWIEFINSTIIRVSKGIMDISKRVSKPELAVLEVMTTYVLQKETVVCEDQSKGHIYIVQNYFKLSDLSKYFSNMQGQCSGRISKAYIAVGHTLFVDTNNTILTDADMTIIAPLWVLVNNVENPVIRLIGSNGKPYDHPAAKGTDYEGGIGSHGCVGTVGKQDGNLVAFSKSMSKLTYFDIVSVSGKGGKGQTGGQGGIGQSTHATYNDEPHHSCCVQEKCYQDHWGYDGGPGGNGGDGGQGGAPAALSGQVTFVEYANLLSLKHSKHSGTVGDIGLGGQGGIGGKPGYGYEKTIQEFFSVESYSRVSGPNGRPGRNGASQLDCTTFVDTPRKVEVSQEVIRYKINQITNPSKHLAELVELISLSNRTHYLWTLQALTEEYDQLKNLDIYRSNSRVVELNRLLTRNLETVSQAYSFTLSEDYNQKVIRILLAECYSTMIFLTRPLSLGLTVDISPYLSGAKTQIIGINENSLETSIQTDKAFLRTWLRATVDQYMLYLRENLTPALEHARTAAEGIQIGAKTLLKLLIEDNSIREPWIQASLAVENRASKSLEKLFAAGAIGRLFHETVIGMPSIEKLFGDLKVDYASDVYLLERVDLFSFEASALLNHLVKADNILMEQCRPLVKPLQDFIHNVSHSLHLDIPFLIPELKLSNSGLSGRIIDCKHKLATLKDASLSSAGVSESLDAASDFFTKVVVIYEAIELYNLTLKMSSSIENVANSPAKTSSDDHIGRLVFNYEQRISQKMLQVILDRASQNFALWVFPFASFYLNDTISNHGTNADNPDQFLKHIERLEENLIDYKTNLTSRIYVKEVPFSTGITGSRPFYTWDNQKYSETISNLLAGQRVTLFADVRNYGLDKMDAIKFKLVELDLQLENVTTELTSEFDSVKESLGVQLTHGGLSSYRINGKYFEIHGHSQTLTYNFKKDHQGNRYGTNLVYEKFKSGEFMLSPYTQWNIQLKLTKGNNSNDNRSRTFENLARFAPYIQLNLVGHGLYVDPRELDTSGDKLMLENFYTEDTRPFLNLRF